MVRDNTLRHLEQIIAKRRRYQTKRIAEKRDLDVKNATIGDLADVLGTLINDLKKQGILG